jgi:hypothetical protein
MKSRGYNAENYLLTESGFINWLLSKLKLDHKRGLLAFIVLCLTWLPLAILSAIEGKLYTGAGLPFIRDIAIHGRILLGIPMLILIKPIVYNRIPRVLKYISDVLIEPEDRDRFFSGALRKAQKSTDALWSEIIILFSVIAFAISPAAELTSFIAEHQSSSWLIDKINGKDVFSMAGNFAQYVSKPVFQFLLVRWLWRYMVWIALLFRISNLKLNLKPTHPDGSGGTSIIFLAQRNFILFFVVCGMVISSVMINLFNDKMVTFEAIKVEIFGYIIFSIVLILFPLLFFTRKLIKTKYEGQLDLSEAGTNLSKRYEDEWVRPMGKEKRIAEETVDPSMQVDYSGVYIFLQGLRILPVRLGDIMIMFISLFIPFIPIFFIQFSIVELLQKLMGLLV